jgi:hypothetical protein
MLRCARAGGGEGRCPSDPDTYAGCYARRKRMGCPAGSLSIRETIVLAGPTIG